MSNIEWLRNPMIFNEYITDIDKFEIALIEFQKLYRSAKSFRRANAVFNKISDFNIYNSVFLHFVGVKSDSHNPRTWDKDRAPRIWWIKDVLDNWNDPRIRLWEEITKKGKRIFLFLEKERYLIILQPIKNYYLIVTSYYINNDQKLVDYKVKYRNYKKKQGVSLTTR